MHRLIRILTVCILAFVTGIFSIGIVNAQNSSSPTNNSTNTKHVVIVSPIRGKDFWESKQTILEVPQKQYQLINNHNLAGTWLVRYDALVEKEVQQFLKSLNKQQEVGLFFEITPTLTKDARVNYNQSADWHYPKSVFLVGYSQQDRIKLIDTYMNKYKEVFGNFPKSVGAWWIDAYSLNYMRDKYQIESNMDVADQHSTDQYQVWGQYFSLPFYPSKYNALIPAQSKDTKIGVVTIQWATRDPLNAYGNGVGDSTYSVQANDYVLHDLGIDYFEQLLNIYPQVTVGLENDFSYQEFGAEYQKQIELIADKVRKGQLLVKTMADFAAYYKRQNPDVSPAELIVANDPLGSEGKVVWYQTPKYRIGWFYGGRSGSAIRDLRTYSDYEKEICYEIKCERLDMARTVSKNLDDVTFNTRWVIDEGKITNFSVERLSDGFIINYVNQAGVERKIRLYPNDIEVNGRIRTIQGAILDSYTTLETTQKQGVSGTNILWTENLTRITVGFLKFLLFLLIFFALPGYVICRRLLLSIPVGWSVFTLITFILGYLNLDLLIWGLPIVSLIGLRWVGIPHLSSLYRFKFRDWLIYLLIVVGSISWLLTNIKSGLLTEYGYGYWGPNGHDGIWHLSLIAELQKNIPPSNPIFSDTALVNYHYFFDLLVAKVGSLFAIDNQDLLFRFFPLLIAILMGLLVWRLVSEMVKTEGAKYWASFFAIFFVYFGGSFGWVVSYFREKSFGGESMFWSQQSVSTLLNPPFAISLILLLTGYMVLKDLFNQSQELKIKELVNFRSYSWQKILVLAIVWGSLIEFKAYAGVILALSLVIFSVERIIIKRDVRALVITIFVGIVSLLVFLPNNQQSGGLIEYYPLWLVKTMVDIQDRLGWQRLSLAIDSGVTYKLIIGYGVAIAIFILGNLGTRILSLLSIKEFFRNSLLAYAILVGMILPLIFIQKGNNWNIVQFFYYSQILLGIFAGISVGYLIYKNRILGLIVGVIVILITLPTSFSTLSQYTPNRPPAMLPKDEIEALEFLSRQPEGVVFSLPFEENRRTLYTEPIPLHAYAPTAYVSAFSKKPVFMEDSINLEILGIDSKARINLSKDIVRIKERANSIFKQNNISYLYILKNVNVEIDEGKMGVEKIFDNQTSAVYRVK